MSIYLEHANVTVRSLERSSDFLKTALPDFQIRGRGVGPHGPWLHIGTGESYLALEEASQDHAGARAAYADPGVNHLGFVVPDAEAVRERLTRAGYREGIRDDSHPFRRRVYFYDPDGNEFEFVEYRSDRPEDRNDYTRG